MHRIANRTDGLLSHLLSLCDQYSYFKINDAVVRVADKSFASKNELTGTGEVILTASFYGLWFPDHFYCFE